MAWFWQAVLAAGVFLLIGVLLVLLFRWQHRGQQERPWLPWGE